MTRLEIVVRLIAASGNPLTADVRRFVEKATEIICRDQGEVELSQAFQDTAMRMRLQVRVELARMLLGDTEYRVVRASKSWWKREKTK